VVDSRGILDQAKRLVEVYFDFSYEILNIWIFFLEINMCVCVHIFFLEKNVASILE
jgi:hypothetical protein